MEISQVSLASTLSLNDGTAPGLTLSKGELVNGLVQNVRPDGMLVLMIKGKLVEAFSEVSVEQGQNIYLSVDDFREGKTFLKVITPDVLTLQRETSLSRNLVSLGINPDNSGVALAKKLVQYNLPVTRENLTEASRALKILGGFSSRNVEIAVFALAKGIPSSEAAIKSLSFFLNSDTDIGKLVNGLINLLGELPDNMVFLPPSAANTNVREATQNLLLSGLKSLPVQAGVPEQVYNTGLADIASNPLPAARQPELLTSPNISGPQTSPAAGEGTLASHTVQPSGGPSHSAQTTAAGEDALVSHSVQPPAVQPSAARPAQPALLAVNPDIDAVLMEAESQDGPLPVSPRGEVGFIMESKTIIRSVLAKLMVNPLDDSESIAKMRNRPIENRSLVETLNTLQTLIKKIDFNTQPELQPLLSRLEGLEREIAGQQLFTAVNPHLPGQESPAGVYYISFPVQFDKEVRQLQIRVQHDGNRQLRDAASLSLVVALDTGSMGKVLFHVDWSKTGYLGLQGVVERSPVGSFLEGNLGGLLEALGSKGFRVENRGISLSGPGQLAASLKPSLNDSPGDVNLSGVDILV